VDDVERRLAGNMRAEMAGEEAAVEIGAAADAAADHQLDLLAGIEILCRGRERRQQASDQSQESVQAEATVHRHLLPRHGDPAAWSLRGHERCAVVLADAARLEAALEGAAQEIHLPAPAGRG